MQPTRGNSGISLSEIAYNRIEEMIVLRQFPAGSMISENQLTEELGCGRTPVREALQRLKIEGYVDVHPRRGALVTPVDAKKQLELLEVRRALEHLTVGLAARRANAVERERLQELSEAIVEAAEKDTATYLGVNRAIHEATRRATHNEQLEKTMRVIHSLSRRFWYCFIEDGQHFAEAAALHRNVLVSIVEKDEAAAQRNASQLMDFLEQLTRNTLERD